MPQVDLETLVSACASRSDCHFKIACETVTVTDHDHTSGEADQPQRNPDSQPESIWFSRDEEYDWWDRNAVYERKESTKGNSNPTNLNPNSNSNSQRFSSNFTSKASIIGLASLRKRPYTTPRTAVATSPADRERNGDDGRKSQVTVMKCSLMGGVGGE